MRVSLNWVLEVAGVDTGTDPAEVARRLTAAGLEVESVEQVGHDISGVVVAEVTEIEELTGFKKPVRYCQVDTSSGESRGVVCGAVNFAVGDRVPLALPGARLPGGFEIGARKTYGHISEGMICSAAELGLGDDHSGILVLSPDAPLGADFVSYAGLDDHVLDIAVTPDRGYALSVRGVSRELATSYGVRFNDPADADLPPDFAAVSDQVHAASIGDPTACDRFVLREMRGFDPAAATPLRMRVRLARAGLRNVSLAVDVTNYLMLELGQPLHAFDADRLSGPIVVRRAEPGEKLETLDHVLRDLDPDDVVIADSSGPISMAGTMGGLLTEISETTSNLVIEAAHFDARAIARESRRHKLFSEASYRFERGVDRELPLRVSAKAAALLAGLGGGTVVPGCTHAQVEVPQVSITMAVDYPDKVAGTVYGRDAVLRRLHDVGCGVAEPASRPQEPDADSATAPVRRSAGSGANRYQRPDHGKHDRSKQMLAIMPPSWRPDLQYPWDLAEEVIRLEGYENVPVRTPRATAGRGLTERQRLRRTTGRSLASSGYVEVLSQPFSSAADFDRLLLPEDDPRRRAPVIANPLNDDEPLLRTMVLPGLLRVLVRNIGRGFADIGLFETGRVFLQHRSGPRTAPILRVDRGPTVAGGGHPGSSAARTAAAHRGRGRRPARPGRLVGRGAPRVLGGRRRGRPPGPAGQPGPVPDPGRPDRAVASGPVRRAVRPGRGGAGLAGRVRGGTAPAGHRRVRPAAQDRGHGTGPVGDRDRRGGARAGRGPGDLAVSGSHPGRRAAGAGERARRGRGGCPHRRCPGQRLRGAAGGRSLVRRLHRGAGRAGA